MGTNPESPLLYNCLSLRPIPLHGQSSHQHYCWGEKNFPWLLFKNEGWPKYLAKFLSFSKKQESLRMKIIVQEGKGIFWTTMLTMIRMYNRRNQQSVKADAWVCNRIQVQKAFTPLPEIVIQMTLSVILPKFMQCAKLTPTETISKNICWENSHTFFQGRIFL